MSGDMYTYVGIISVLWKKGNPNLTISINTKYQIALWVCTLAQVRS